MTNIDITQINDLIKSVANGEQSALTALYNTIGGRLLSVGFAVLKDRQLAEDALSETFVKIVDKADTFRLWQNGYGWACTIMRNTALNILKKRKRLNEINLSDQLFNTIPQSTSDIDKWETQNAVQSALHSLSESARQLIMCKYFADLTVRQTADLLKMSKSAVSRQTIEAESSLKDILIKMGQMD